MNRLTLALLAALGSTACLALEKPYVGIDYQVQTQDFGASVEAEPDALRIRMGSDVNSFLSVEAQAGLGMSSDSVIVDTAGTTWDVQTDSFYALFLKPRVDIGDSASIFALVGGSYLDLSASSNTGKSETGFEHGFAYGFGADVKVYKQLRLSADFIQYLDDVSAISVGVRIPL